MLWGEAPVDILGELTKIPKVPIYIVQGKGSSHFHSYVTTHFCNILGDEVTPPEFAMNLENLFRTNGYEVTSYYVDDGHKVSGNAIRDAVRLSAVKFSEHFLSQQK